VGVDAGRRREDVLVRAELIVAAEPVKIPAGAARPDEGTMDLFPSRLSSHRGHSPQSEMLYLCTEALMAPTLLLSGPASKTPG
jgi:hypothetical protein